MYGGVCVGNLLLAHPGSGVYHFLIPLVKTQPHGQP